MRFKYNFAISLLVIASVTVLQSQIRDVIISRYPNGLKKEIIVYEGEGRNETIIQRLYYSETGLLEKEIDNESGKEKTFYETGVIKSVHDVESGKDTTFFITGEIQSSALFDSSGIHLEEKKYYKNGNIKTKKFKNIFISYNENGRIKKEIIKYGLLDFERKEYFYDDEDTTVVILSKKNGKTMVKYHSPNYDNWQLKKKTLFDETEKINEKYNEYAENGDTITFLPLIDGAYLGRDFKSYSNEQRKIINLFSTIVTDEVQLTVINFINLPFGSDSNTNNSEITNLNQGVDISGFIQVEAISDILFTNFLMKLELLNIFSSLEINVDETTIFTNGLFLFSLSLQTIETISNETIISTIPKDSFYYIFPQSAHIDSMYDLKSGIFGTIEEATNAGGLSLTGISLSGGSGFAIINGKAVKEDEVLSGYRIEKITNSHVILRNINYNYILRLTLN